MKPGLTDIAYMVDGDAAYKEMALVSLYSLARVCRHPVSVHMYYMDGGALDGDYVSAAGRVASVNSDVRVLMKDIPSRYRGVLRATSEKTPLGPMCCGRLLLPHLLPGVGQCLYMDSDTLFLRDPADTLEGAWDEWSLEHDTAGVPDYLGTRYGGSYVNAGVLLMDLDLWRKRNMSEIVVFDVLTHSRSFCDQDSINAVARPVRMPHEMNLIASWPMFGVPVSEYDSFVGASYGSYEEAVESAVVLHYTGGSKPFGGRSAEGRGVPGVDAMLRKYETVYEEYSRRTGRRVVSDDAVPSGDDDGQDKEEESDD